MANQRLKNYTSTVPVSRTVSQIEEVLARANATGISKSYDNGRLTALMFHVALPGGKMATIKLPANSESVYKAMLKEVKRPQRGTHERLKDQAERTAWKLMQDWIEVQLSLIMLQQAEWIEVFMPYVWDGERTFYTRIKEGQFKALPDVNGTGL